MSETGTTHGTSQHQAAAVRAEVDTSVAPPFVGDLAKHHRSELKTALANREWSPKCAAAYRELAAEVGRVTASQWRKSVATKRQREALLWRLLRIGPAPYYVLGSARDRALRLLVTTPWDWRRRFEFRDLEIWGEEAGQPKIGWRATVRDHEAAEEPCVDGHVEMRWSHGRCPGTGGKGLPRSRIHRCLDICTLTQQNLGLGQ